MTIANDDNDQTIRLSSAVRAMLSLSAQMDFDRENFFNEERYKSYVKMHATAEQKKDNCLRSLLLLDSLMVFLALGQPVQIPGLGMNIAQLPAAVEIATVLSALGFFFFLMIFVDAQVYAMLVRQFNVRKVRGTLIDPNFLTASDMFINFSVVMSQETLNYGSKDFFVPHWGLKVFSFLHNKAIQALGLLFLFGHFSATYLSLSISYHWMDGWVSYVYPAAIVLVNALGVLMYFGHSFDFKYTIANIERPRDNRAVNGAPPHAPVAIAARGGHAPAGE